MALQGVIIRSLYDAAKSGDGQVLKDAYSAITQNLSRQSTHRAGLETLIICAETALQVLGVKQHACIMPHGWAGCVLRTGARGHTGLCSAKHRASLNWYHCMTAHHGMGTLPGGAL